MFVLKSIHEAYYNRMNHCVNMWNSGKGAKYRCPCEWGRLITQLALRAQSREVNKVSCVRFLITELRWLVGLSFVDVIFPDYCDWVILIGISNNKWWFKDLIIWVVASISEIENIQKCWLRVTKVSWKFREILWSAKESDERNEQRIIRIITEGGGFPAAKPLVDT